MNIIMMEGLMRRRMERLFLVLQIQLCGMKDASTKYALQNTYEMIEILYGNRSN